MSDRRARASDWLQLDLRLRLHGCEERRRADLRAFRDRKRPRIFDRHLVLPSGPPVVPVQDVRSLDQYYGETRAPQWSFLDLEGKASEPWVEQLGALGLSYERFVLMEQETADAVIAPEVVILDGDDRYATLETIQREFAEGTPVAAVVSELVDVQRQLDRAGQPSVVLAYREAGEWLAYMVVMVAGERCWMEDLETRIDRRGQGIARALLRAASVVASRRGARFTGFTADASDWPWHWYRREGWKLVGHYVRMRRLL